MNRITLCATTLPLILMLAGCGEHDVEYYKSHPSELTKKAMTCAKLTDEEFMKDQECMAAAAAIVTK